MFPAWAISHEPSFGAAFSYHFPERAVRGIAKLTEKQKRFVEEYLIDLNATQAAIRAGYGARNADQQGHQLLKKTSVADAIAAAKAERSRRTGICADRVLRELARLAFVDPTDVVDFDTGEVRPDACADDRAVLAGVKIKDTEKGTEREVRLTDKLRALELLGRHLGLFEPQGGASGAAIAEFLAAVRPAQAAVSALFEGEAETDAEDG